MSGKVIALIFLVIVALVGIPATLYLVKSQQDTRSRASEGTEFIVPDSTFATDVVSPTISGTGGVGGACQVPAQVTGVIVEYPNIANGSADFTQGSCSWGQVTGATQYVVKITEVESGTVKVSQDVSSSQTKITFPVTNGKTYQCDISAKNSCGDSGLVGSHSLFCQTDALISTTVGPTVPITVPPTVPPQVTSPPQPTIPPTGISAPFITIGAVSGILVLIGGALLLL